MILGVNAQHTWQGLDMIKRNKELTEMYHQYKDLVKNVSRSFKKKFPDDDLEDLTQSCWEQIIRRYDTYDEGKAKMSTWITILCSSTLMNLARDNNAAKRGVTSRSVSIETLDALKDKFS